jgi:hypothetical protein
VRGEANSTHYVEDSLPQKAKWARVECDFPNIKGSNTTGEAPSIFGEIFTLANNPVGSSTTASPRPTTSAPTS